MLGFSSIRVSLYTLLVLAHPLALGAQSISDEGNGIAVPGTVDCTDISVDYVDEAALTPDEKIARMDRALFRSLSKFDLCAVMNARSQSNSGGNGSVDLGSDVSTGGGGSLASPGISGTEIPIQRDSHPSTQYDFSRSALSSSPEKDVAENTAKQTPRVMNSGKIPDDIPPADNDSVLQSQIRQAARNEEDPHIRENLWDEYRRYKTLNVDE